MVRAVRLLAAFLVLAAASLAFPRAASANGLLVSEPPGAVAPEVRATETSRGPVRLVRHHVEVRIKGRLAQVEVEQTFHNASGQTLEGTYLFPLPEHAVVGAFAMTAGGHTLKGEVLDAREARRIYPEFKS